MYAKFIKRILDLVLSFIIFPIAFVICVIASLFIYFEDRGSVFYIAKRRGRGGKIFNMYKLRSMKMNAPDIRNADNSTFNSPDDPRITKTGRVLRKTSIDELPQILNIIKGDMSWIGPRPVTIDKPLEEYDKKRFDRLKVRPGITGYSQAYFRNSISQEEKLQYDADYANSVSFKNDFKIFFKTIDSVIRRKNIYNNKVNNINAKSKA